MLSEKERAYQRAWKKANREKVNADGKDWMRAYRAANPEKVRALGRAQYAANPEKVRARKRAQRAANLQIERAKERARARAQRAANPEKARANCTRRRARKKGANRNDLTAAQIREVKARSRCYRCKKPIKPGTGHLDHIIPLSKGGDHTFSNVEHVHARCNLSKGDRIETLF